MSPELTLDVPVVDRQHAQILQFLQKLTQGPVTRPELVAAIGAYTDRHFVVEEELMAAHGYPGLDEHKAEHAVFKGKIARLLEAMGQDEIAASRAIAEYLEAWLTRHIATADRPMAEFLRMEGLAPSC